MLKRIQAIKERYYGWVAGAIFVISLVLVLGCEINPSLKCFLIETGAINIIVLLFIMDSVQYLIKISDKLEANQNVWFFKNQAKASRLIDDYIKDQKPKRADLIQYSSYTVQDILYNLKMNGTVIRLLIAHPDIAISERQKRRILNRIESLVEIDFKDYADIEIRCYKDYPIGKTTYTAFPSLRAINLNDQFICFSWYTPTTKIEGGICGHDTPMICGRTNTEPGEILVHNFNEIFAILWENGTPIQDVYRDYSLE